MGCLFRLHFLNQGDTAPSQNTRPTEHLASKCPVRADCIHWERMMFREIAVTCRDLVGAVLGVASFGPSPKKWALLVSLERLPQKLHGWLWICCKEPWHTLAGVSSQTH